MIYVFVVDIVLRFELNVYLILKSVFFVGVEYLCLVELINLVNWFYCWLVWCSDYVLINIELI